MLLVMSGSTDPVFIFKTGVVFNCVDCAGSASDRSPDGVTGGRAGWDKRGIGVVDVQIFAMCCVKCTKHENCIKALLLQTLPGFDFVMWWYIPAWMTC